jgi:hypothetical protein
MRCVMDSKGGQAAQASQLPWRNQCFARALRCPKLRLSPIVAASGGKIVESSLCVSANTMAKTLAACRRAPAQAAAAGAEAAARRAAGQGRQRRQGTAGFRVEPVCGPLQVLQQAQAGQRRRLDNSQPVLACNFLACGTSLSLASVISLPNLSAVPAPTPAQCVRP